jgi:DNA (cytosine-5)-methyltransferase 1
LQGFPDDYFDRAVAAGVSNSQLYKQAGNAVTVNVAEAIGRRLKEIELGWLNQEECNELVANLEVVEAKED